MKAFHDKQETKDFYLNRVKQHALADEIIKGQYWEDGKGCAVGCTIHSSDHAAYETELGIPRWLARVEDKIFEGLPNERTKKWPEEFLSAIKPGVDLDKIKAPFLIFVLESTLDKFGHEKYPKVKKAVCDVIELYKTGETDPQKFRAAAYAAADAAYAADAAAAAYAAYAADAAAAAYAAYAADAAAYAADAADAAYAAAYAAAKENAYVKFADKILELVRELK